MALADEYQLKIVFVSVELAVSTAVWPLLTVDAEACTVGAIGLGLIVTVTAARVALVHPADAAST